MLARHHSIILCFALLCFALLVICKARRNPSSRGRRNIISTLFGYNSPHADGRLNDCSKGEVEDAMTSVRSASPPPRHSGHRPPTEGERSLPTSYEMTVDTFCVQAVGPQPYQPGHCLDQLRTCCGLQRGRWSTGCATPLLGRMLDR